MLQSPLSEANPLVWGKMVTYEDLSREQQREYCKLADSGDHSCYMTLAEAVRYCNIDGRRLPSAREFADWAKSHGAKGILTEDAYIRELNGLPEGRWTTQRKAYRVYTQESERVDMFFYSYAGYFPPKDFSENHWFWSSSVLPAPSNNQSLFFNGRDGGIGFTHSSMDARNSVRCVGAP